MIPVLIVSAIAALGVLRLQRLAFPSAPPLADQAARWERARSRADRRSQLNLAAGEQSWSQKVAEWFAEQLRTKRPDDLQTYERDLAITGQPMEEWLARTLVWFLIGLLGPVVLVLLGNAAGLGLPLLAAPAIGLLFGVVAVIAEVKKLREDAGVKREEMCDALSDFLDLVVMAMEGGSSHAEALPSVAGKGTGWAFHTLADAIDNARPNGMTPWQALGEIGEQFGVVELIDLRASLNLAQDEGTSVRNTLIARAQSMRDGRLADANARASKSTDAMRNTLMIMALVAAAYVILARVLFLFTA